MLHWVEFTWRIISLLKFSLSLPGIAEQQRSLVFFFFSPSRVFFSKHIAKRPDSLTLQTPYPYLAFSRHIFDTESSNMSWVFILMEIFGRWVGKLSWAAFTVLLVSNRGPLSQRVGRVHAGNHMNAYAMPNMALCAQIDLF